MRPMTGGEPNPLFVLCLFCAAAIVATACHDPPKPPVVGGSMADSAEQVLIGVKTLITNRGVRGGEIFADTTFIFDDQTRFVFSNVRVSFTKDNGAPNGTMRADRGQYSMRTMVLDGWGNVVVTSVDSQVLKTPQLRYNKAANSITSDTSFVLTRKDGVQRGIGLVTDPDLNHIRIGKAASGAGNVVIPPDR